MARLFDDGSSEYLSYEDGALLSDMPCALVGWARSDDTTILQHVAWIGDKDQTSYYASVGLDGTEENDSVFCFTHNYGYTPGNGSNAEFFYATAGYSANTWIHVAAIFADSADLRVFANGGNKGTSTAARTFHSHDAAAIGCANDNSPGGYFSGGLAEVGFYDLSNWGGATGGEKGDSFEAILPALASGYSPLCYPLGLVGYYPLGGTYGRHDNDIVGGYDMTAYNTPSWADHPPIIYPNTGIVVPWTAAAVGSPWYYYAQQAG